MSDPATTCHAKPAKTVGLPVLGSSPAGHPDAKSGHPPIRKSRVSKWRAAVLIAVHVVMILHLLQWLRDGVTVSPVEPSESMYALEAGEINAGVIFFAIAIASTFLLGRLFCGWGCHIVALQDLCGSIMHRLGVRPKPFRSRLLVWAPVVLAFYMFVWPTLRREALHGFVRESTQAVLIHLAGDAWSQGPLAIVRDEAVKYARAPLPSWMGETNPFPGLSNAIIVEDYWETFAPWYIAIPFIGVVCFAAVYFLGNKGFCTYGCPYGGVFGPVDRLAVGRIVVNDKCEGCGHCTAVCTSNVRVHQEVRDFGMVVSPGCMKCLDCVSVCPNDALSYKLAKPAFLVKPRNASAAQVRKPEYDLSWPAEFGAAALMLGFFMAFRGAFNQVPMLMAVAIAGCLTFCVWKVLRIVRTPNVRVQSVQLRLKGRITVAGWIFILLTVACTGLGVWSGAVRATQAWASHLDGRVLTAESVVFSPGYAPSAADQAAAREALRFFAIGGGRKDGGFGWNLAPAQLTRAGWLAAVAGDLPLAESYLRRALEGGNPNEAMVVGFRTVLMLQSKTNTQWQAELDGILAMRPQADNVRIARAFGHLQAGDLPRFREHLHEVLDRGRHGDEQAQRRAAESLAQIAASQNDLDGFRDAQARLERLTQQRPTSLALREAKAGMAASLGEWAEAEKWLLEALERRPRSVPLWRQVEAVRAQSGDTAGAREAALTASRHARYFATW